MVIKCNTDEAPGISQSSYFAVNLGVKFGFQHQLYVATNVVEIAKDKVIE